MLTLTPSRLHTLHRPDECERRVYLAARSDERVEPGAWELHLRERGIAHEAAHLAALRAAGREVVDLGGGPRAERARRTREHLLGPARRPGAVLYQAVLETRATLGGVACRVTGDPDFVLLGEGPGDDVVRDAKLALRISAVEHPEILRQLGTYAWLHARATGHEPAALEVVDGHGEVVALGEDVAAAAGEGALADLARIARLATVDDDPRTPVRWGACRQCVFGEHCWGEAERARDVAIVDGVDRGLTEVLRAQGVVTLEQLLERHDPLSLAALERPWGARTRRVGRAAPAILRSARALVTGEPIVLGPPALPDHPSPVMFDLEGVPPEGGEPGHVYLWGMQVYGEAAGAFRPALAEPGPADREVRDERGWRRFLAVAGELCDALGDPPFVHWSPYERTQIRSYVERWGDPDGTAARVLEQLVDLLPVTRAAVVLPLSSYGLKTVEEYVGFRRSQVEYGGDWSIARFLEAEATDDRAAREAIVAEILTYNEEDLAATWAVYDWLGRIDAGAAASGPPST